MADSCLVVLCGLPGAGKTKLSDEIIRVVSENVNAQGAASSEENKVNCVCVCYDKLFPAEGEAALLQSSSNEPSPWKIFRNDILMCVKLLLTRKAGYDQHALEDLATTIPQELLQRFCLLVFRQQYKPNLEGESTHVYPTDRSNFSVPDLGNKTVFIIDDNMYYKSMRYEYYQLAREFNTGFCQIFIACKPEVALERNRDRARSVPDHVILEMAKKIELPDTSEDWQSNSLTIESHDEAFASHVITIKALIENAFQNPVVSKTIDINPEIQEHSRYVCSKNMLHQSDQILRKLTSNHLKALDKREVNVRQEAERINKLKVVILTDIERGVIRPDCNILSHVENASKDLRNPYFLYLAEIFNEKTQYPEYQK